MNDLARESVVQAFAAILRARYPRRVITIIRPGEGAEAAVAVAGAAGQIERSFATLEDDDPVADRVALARARRAPDEDRIDGGREQLSLEAAAVSP